MTKLNELSARAQETLKGLEDMHQSELGGMADAADNESDLMERLKGALVAHTKMVAVCAGLMSKMAEKPPQQQAELCAQLGKYIAEHSFQVRATAEAMDFIDFLMGRKESDTKGGNDADNPTAH